MPLPSCKNRDDGTTMIYPFAMGKLSLIVSLLIMLQDVIEHVNLPKNNMLPVQT